MKRNLVLVGLVLLLGLLTAALPAAAQVQFESTGGLRKVRAEGRAEIVSAVDLVARTTGTVKAGTSITITYDAEVVNIIDDDNVTCVVTVGTCTVGTDVTVATVGNELTLSFVNDVAFAIDTDSITVSGVRINVADLAAGTTRVGATISVTGDPSGNRVTFTDPDLYVAQVNASIDVDFTEAEKGILTCDPPGAFGLPDWTFKIKVTELFAAALTTEGQEVADSADATEVENGTKLRVQIKGVPLGLEVRYDGTTGATGVLALTEDADDDNPAESDAANSTLTFNFDVTASNTGLAEEITLNFSVADTNNDALALGPATLTASVALTPIDNTTADDPPLYTIISFKTNLKGPENVVGVADCVTNLLFPWVVNVVGYDSGIAIVNTTKDPFGAAVGGAVAQSGTCTLTGYPTDGGAAVTYTSPSVPAGGATTLVASGVTAFQGFAGYVIAVCNFQNGHGFAYITDNFGVGAPSTAQGYVALVIPAPQLDPRTAAEGESLGE